MRIVRSHQAIQRDFEIEGQKIRNETVLEPFSSLSETCDELVTLRTQFSTLLQEHGLKRQDEKLLDAAYVQAMQGDFKRFGAMYRAVQPGQDEHFATQNQAHLIHGFERSRTPFPSLRHEAMARKAMMETMKLNSLLRSDTLATGYHIGPNNQLQHPTQSPGGLFGPSGINHNYRDRLRGELTLSRFANSSESGSKRLRKLPYFAEVVTQSMFQAPPTAGNQQLVLSDPTRIDSATDLRELFKRLGGPTTATQPRNASWRPKRNARSFTPARVTPVTVLPGETATSNARRK